jgi:16S rRNA (guanine527-N7)-methyltransferase
VTGMAANPGTATEIAMAVEAAGLPRLQAEVAEKFAIYLELLVKWNAKLNLTAIREPSEIIRRHFVECVQCALALPAVATLLDFGSGAGLPGIPIAIVRPEIRVTLGESQMKKAVFLREAVRVLGLNVEVFDGRVEGMASGRTFDAVTLRAVDRMAEATQAGLARMRAGGLLVVFTTSGALDGMKNAVSGVTWGQEDQIVGLDRGLLLQGRKS